MNQSDLLPEGPSRRENHYLLCLWEGNAFEQLSNVRLNGVDRIRIDDISTANDWSVAMQLGGQVRCNYAEPTRVGMQSLPARVGLAEKAPKA